MDSGSGAPPSQPDRPTATPRLGGLPAARERFLARLRADWETRRLEALWRTPRTPEEEGRTPSHAIVVTNNWRTSDANPAVSPSSECTAKHR